MATESGFDWYRKSKERDSYWIERAKNSFALMVERVMKQKDVKKKDLAEKLGQSPANISKVLRGDANLTIETMTKLALALDAEVSIQLTPRMVSAESWSEYTASSHTAVPKDKPMPVLPKANETGEVRLVARSRSKGRNGQSIVRT